MVPKDIVGKHTLPDIISQQLVETGIEAMKTSGIQKEFAAQLLMMSTGTNTSIILRAGQPPNYDGLTAPKPGNISSKSSTNQGFFNGYLAAEDKFTRVEIESGLPVGTRGITEKDKKRMELPITDPNHLFTKQLTVCWKDIYKQIGSNGDLKVDGYNKEVEEISFSFKEGKGSPDFKGQFIIDLNDSQAHSHEQHFSRPWNKPENFSEDLIALSKQLDMDASYLEEIANKEFPLYYYNNADDIDLMPAKVFTRTPHTYDELEYMLNTSRHSFSDSFSNQESLADALNTLGDGELKSLYDDHGRFITGDWDGMTLGHPLDLDSKYLEKYNTFDLENFNEQTQGLIRDSRQLLDEFKDKVKQKPEQDRTHFDKFVEKINFRTDLRDQFALERAGVITPYEFLYQQLSNYAYRQESNWALGENSVMSGLQDSVNIATQKLLDPDAQWNHENRQLTIEERDSIVAEAKEYLSKEQQSKGVVSAIKNQSQEHLQGFLEKNLTLNNASKLSVLEIPHPDFDKNIDNLFQHGFDMRNPYGVEADGPWLMAANNGMILRGDNHAQLVSVLLAEDGKLLKDSYFDVSPKIEMRSLSDDGLGWADVVKKQVELGQPVPEATLDAMSKSMLLEQNNEPDSKPDVNTETSAVKSAADSVKSVLSWGYQKIRGTQQSVEKPTHKVKDKEKHSPENDDDKPTSPKTPLRR